MAVRMRTRRTTSQATRSNLRTQECVQAQCRRWWTSFSSSGVRVEPSPRLAPEVAGRNHPDASATVGYFANPLPFRADLSGEPSFRDLLEQVRATVLEALVHQDVPFPVLIKRLQPRRDPSRNPVAEALFVLQQPPKSAQFAALGARVPSQAAQ